MKDYQTKFLRNIALVGHGGDGKTTLIEAFLYSAGSIDRMGRVEDGTATTDYDPEENRRTISISTAVANLEWKNHKITFIDVPGYFDFAGEMQGGLAAADGALVVVGAVSGVSVGSEKALNMSIKQKLPRAVVVNSMDRENANFDKVYGELQETFPGVAFAPLMLPIMDGPTFKGYTLVSSGKSYEFAGKKGEVKEVPTSDDMLLRIEEIMEGLVEAAAGADDELMEKYFEEGTLSPEEMQKGLAAGIASGDITPIFCSAAVPNLGASTIMDFIVDVFPAPKAEMTGKSLKDGSPVVRKCDTAAPFSALVFKTLADPFVGKISLLKVMSGELTSDTSFVSARNDKPAKAGTVSVMRGKKLTTVDKLIAGDIGVLTKLAVTVTGDTLCAPGEVFAYDFPKPPVPAISMAVFAKNKNDEDKVFSSLVRLTEEDPSFTIAKDPETAESIISGQGEMHLDVLVNKAQTKFGVACELADPKIAYRETIKKSIKAEGRHKKQSGGHGQFGHCWIEFEPIFDGTQDFEFVDKVVGGVVPRAFIPAVEKGLRENLPRGVIAGYPLVNIRATLYDGSYHAVDSSEMAFKTAARLALKKCVDANPVLLEPIYKLEIYVPDEYMGDVIGDMNRRRGRIMGMDQVETGQKVTAEAPLSEVFKYATDLRAMTQARGSFVKEFVRYEEVPANIAQKIIANAHLEDDDE